MGSGKPHGINAGRKLKIHRRNNRYIISHVLNNSLIDGLIRDTRKLTQVQSGRNPSWEHLWLQVSLLKRSLLKLSNQTQLLESVSECNWRRTIKESLPSFPVMVVWLLLMKMMKYLLLDSVDLVTPSVICQESDSKLPR